MRGEGRGSGRPEDWSRTRKRSAARKEETLPHAAAGSRAGEKTGLWPCGRESGAGAGFLHQDVELLCVMGAGRGVRAGPKCEHFPFLFSAPPELISWGDTWTPCLVTLFQKTP